MNGAPGATAPYRTGRAHPWRGIRPTLLAVGGACLLSACGESREIAELRARNDSLATAVERLTTVNDSLADALRHQLSESERLASEARFWQSQSEGWRVIAEGGPPTSSTPRRR